jgi:putative membrane protein
MKVCFKTLAGVVAFGLLAFAQSQPDQSKNPSGGAPAHDMKTANRMSGGDQTFAMKAAQGGLAEVQFGNLAKEKASSPDVKSFGEMMVADHSKANDELKEIASTKGITLPTSMDAKSQAMYDRMSKLSGAAFDKAYMKDMVADHKMDVNEFKKQSERGTDAELKAFAAKTLPTLQKHLQTAEETNSKLGK